MKMFERLNRVIHGVTHPGTHAPFRPNFSSPFRVIVAEFRRMRRLISSRDARAVVGSSTWTFRFE